MSLVPLVTVDASIASSYGKDGKTGGPRATCISLRNLGKAGVATAEMAAALKLLSDAVAARGGDFRVTECHRDIAVQKGARAKYDNWVKAGKPKPGTAAFDAKTMKAAFVAQPGRSGHNAGRSIDIHLGMLNFPGTPADKQLDVLWELARPLGWEPIIKTADESASEAWHFDFVGDLAGVKARLGYEQWALCGAILVGHGDISGYEAEVQALLSRAGQNLGAIDGKAGNKTRAALADALGISVDAATSLINTRDGSVLTKLLSLPAK